MTWMTLYQFCIRCKTARIFTYKKYTNSLTSYRKKQRKNLFKFGLNSIGEEIN